MGKSMGTKKGKIKPKISTLSNEMGQYHLSARRNKKIIAKNEKGEPCEERIIKTAGNPDKIYLKSRS